MNEKLIQISLYRDLFNGSQVIMPNYSPNNWWECDLLSVSKAGFWTEHEIKISVADFNADKEKSRQFRYGDKIQNKHLLLESKTVDGPNYFYYVVPEELANKIVIPDWAGLKTCVSYGKRCHINVVKRAPKLHGNKIDQKVIDHMRGVCYYRYWTERVKRYDESQNK